LQNNRTVSNPSEPASPLAQGGSEACGLSFRDLVENINDVIFSLDVEGRIEYVSPAVERFTRYHPGEVTGQPFSRYVLPEDVEGLMANFQHALQGVLNPSEFRMVTKDGELRHMRTSSRLRLEDGKVAGLTGVMTDITERVQGEVALKEARENLERRAEERARELLESNLSLQGEVAERRRAERAQGALYRISEATHVLQDLPSLLQQIHQILGELLPVLSFYVALYDQATDELTFPYYVDEFHGPPDSRKLSDGLTDRVIRTGEPLLLSRETHEAFLEKEKIPVQRMPVLDWLGVPLVAQKRTIGALMVQSYDPKVRYTESDKALLQFVSDQIATAIERTRSEQALRLSEQRFQRVAESTGEWIWEIDREGVYTYSNGVVEAMLGYRPEEIVGRLRPQDLFVPQERETLVRVVSELLAKQQPFTGFVNTLVHKDGRRVILETRGVPVFDEGGTLTGYRGTKTNITDRVQAERKRYNLERKIQEAQRLESLGLLAGGIAHDFNNILNAILGYLELSSQDLPEDSPVQNRLERAGKACQAAADLCRQMLAFSGRERFLVKPLDLNEVLTEIARMLEVSVSKKATLLVQLAPSLPFIKADTSQLQQVIMNLVVNASEALGTQSGTITLRTALVHADREYLSAARMAEELSEGDYVCLEVTDTGCGMAPEILSRIFDPFFTTKFTGRGLGLAAVLGIVRGHRGGVRVQSQPGVGSTFTILFPAQESVLPKPTAAPVSSTWRGSGRVLLVDDDVVLRELGKEFLDRLGFDAITARDGVEAVEMFQAHRDKLVCILLDLTMPRMDGMEAFQELRRLGCQIPVIIVSGFAEKDVAEKMAEQGLAGFIQKPYSRATLVARLAEVLTDGGSGGTQ